MFIKVLHEDGTTEKYLQYSFEQDDLNTLIKILGEATLCYGLYEDLTVMRKDLDLTYPVEVTFVFKTPEDLDDLRNVMGKACYLYDFYKAVKKLQQEV
jgi:hypothetical protein